MKNYQLYILTEDSDDLPNCTNWYKIGIRRVAKNNKDSFSKLMNGNPRKLSVKWYICDAEYFLQYVYKNVIEELKMQKIKGRDYYTDQPQHKGWYNIDLNDFINLVHRIYLTSDREFTNNNFENLFNLEN